MKPVYFRKHVGSETIYGKVTKDYILTLMSKEVQNGIYWTLFVNYNAYLPDYFDFFNYDVDEETFNTAFAKYQIFVSSL